MTDPAGRIETVEGKTFEEWVTAYEQIATPYQARELAASKMGYPLGPQAVDEAGNPVEREGEEEDTL